MRLHQLFSNTTVRAHTRTTKSGKIVQVSEHQDSRQASRQKSGAGVKTGLWVVNPHTGRRGVVDHIYEDNKNAKGRLVQVDFGADERGRQLHVNFREADLKASADQKSRWADKPDESGTKKAPDQA